MAGSISMGLPSAVIARAVLCARAISGRRKVISVTS